MVDFLSTHELVNLLLGQDAQLRYWNPDQPDPDVAQRAAAQAGGGQVAGAELPHTVTADEDGYCVLVRGGLVLTAMRPLQGATLSLSLRCAAALPLQRAPYHAGVGPYGAQTLLTAYAHSVLVRDSMHNDACIGVLTVQPPGAGLTKAQLQAQWTLDHLQALSSAIVEAEAEGVEDGADRAAFKESLTAMQPDRANLRASRVDLSHSAIYNVRNGQFGTLQARYNREMAARRYSLEDVYTFFIHPPGRKHPLGGEDDLVGRVARGYELRMLHSLQVSVGRELTVPGHSLYWRRTWLDRKLRRVRRPLQAAVAVAETGDRQAEEGKVEVEVKEVDEDDEGEDEGEEAALVPPVDGEAVEGVTAEAMADGVGAAGGGAAHRLLRRGRRRTYFPHAIVDDATNCESSDPLPELVNPQASSYAVLSMTLYNTSSRSTRWVHVRPHTSSPKAFKAVYFHGPLSQAEVNSFHADLRRYYGALQAQRVGGIAAALRLESIVHIPVPDASLAPSDDEVQAWIQRALTEYLGRSGAVMHIERRHAGAFHVLPAWELWQHHVEPVFRLYSTLALRLLQERVVAGPEPPPLGWSAPVLTLFEYAVYQLERLSTLQESDVSVLRHLDSLCRDERRLGIPQRCFHALLAPLPQDGNALASLLDHVLPISQWPWGGSWSADSTLRGKRSKEVWWMAQMMRRCKRVRRGMLPLCTLAEERALHNQLAFSWALAEYQDALRRHHLVQEVAGWVEHEAVVSAVQGLYKASFDAMLSDATTRLLHQRQGLAPLRDLMKPMQGRWDEPVRQVLEQAKKQLVAVEAVDFLTDALLDEAFNSLRGTKRPRTATYAFHGVDLQVKHAVVRLAEQDRVQLSMACEAAVRRGVEDRDMEVSLDVTATMKNGPIKWVRFVRRRTGGADEVVPLVQPMGSSASVVPLTPPSPSSELTSAVAAMRPVGE